MKNQPLISAKTRSVFTVLWSLSVYFHVISEYKPLHHISNGDFGEAAFWFGIESLFLGVAALVLIFRPNSGRLMLTVATLQLVNVWMAAPFIDNHWALGGLVSLAILASALGVKLNRADSNFAWDEHFFAYLIPAAILILIASYPFAAFAKWNSAFLNPEVSCAVDLFARGYELFGLDQLTQFLAVRWGLIVIGLVSETIIAILILFPRTRAWGALIGLFFHFIVAFDPVIPFFDFSSILALLFVICLPTDIIDQLADRADLQFPLPWKKLLVVGLMTAILLAPLVDHEGARLFFALGRQGVWLFVGVAILIWVFKRMVLDRRKLNRSIPILPENGSAAFARIQKAVLLALLCCALVIGLSPWFELQTGYGLVMYSNLLTAGGETNHLLVPRTFPIGQGYSDLIEITGSNDANFSDFYIDSDWQLPAVTLRRALADAPDLDAEIVRNGVSSTLSRETDLFEPLPYFQRKFQNLRPVDRGGPVRCQLATHPIYADD